MVQIPKHKPPSRIRYEKSHPTISFRLNKELKTRLEDVLEKESFASFIKEVLGKREREKESMEEKLSLKYDEGYHEGYDEAKRKFLVYAPCVVCGEPLVVYGKEDKKELAGYMQDQHWCHRSCVEPRRAVR